MKKIILFLILIIGLCVCPKFVQAEGGDFSPLSPSNPTSPANIGNPLNWGDTSNGSNQKIEQHKNDKEITFGEWLNSSTGERDRYQNARTTKSFTDWRNSGEKDDPIIQNISTLITDNKDSINIPISNIEKEIHGVDNSTNKKYIIYVVKGE